MAHLTVRDRWRHKILILKKKSLIFFFNICSPHTPPLSFYITKVNSADTAHYWEEEDGECLSDMEAFKGPATTLQNAKNVFAKEEGNLPISNKLSKNAKIETVLPKLKNSSLISLRQLRDDNCDVLLNKRRCIWLKIKKSSYKWQEKNLIVYVIYQYQRLTYLVKKSNYWGYISLYTPSNSTNNHQ